MKITFLGVGEAFDAELGNSSFLLKAESTVLIDCGFAAVERYFRAAIPANALDAVYLTHFHGDHCFGLPALFLRLRDEGRTAPLTIISQPGVSHYVEKLVELAYPGNFAKLGYSLEFIETLESCRFNELTLTFAPTVHSVRNMAVCFSVGEERIAFSGDGELTAESRALYQQCNILVHESYTLEREAPNHTSAKELLAVCEEFPALESLFLVHVNHKERRLHRERFQELGNGQRFSVLLPEPGFEFSLL